MAVIVKGRKGKNITLLNPSEKGTKYADELRNNARITNDGHLKIAKYGGPERLTKEQRAYRAGYLSAQKDSAACWKAKNK